eukprot:9814657-Ditylum_brightwellii.AAC.1
MHGCELLLKYAMGIKDNHATDSITGIKLVTTPGAEGLASTPANNAITCMRAIIDFFGTPKRQQRLVSFAEAVGYK